MFELIQDTYLDQSLPLQPSCSRISKNWLKRHDRDVRQAGFLVPSETAMPSVLIETELAGNKENSFLLTDEGEEEISHSIYGSLLNYLNKLDAKDNLPMSGSSKK